MKDIPMNLLRRFVTAMDHGSFTRAAGFVGRTP